LGEQPPGILFYRAKESFFLSYGLLAAMRWQGERLTLTFAVEDVVIEGRGLHELYARLAEHKVTRICEQGERYAEAAEGTVSVREIRRVFRVEAEPAQKSEESFG
jgi:hypothetical protein